MDESTYTLKILMIIITGTGNPNARELLVLKLLDERRKNAARLQHQLMQQSTLSSNGTLNDTTATEIEMEEGERDGTGEEFDSSRSEEEFEDTHRFGTGNGSNDKLFHSVDERTAHVSRSIFLFFIIF